LKTFLLVAIISTPLAAIAKTGGPSIKYDKMSDSTFKFENQKTTYALTNATITSAHLMVPTTNILGGDFILLGSYWKDDMTIKDQTSGAKVKDFPIGGAYETIPAGFVWVEKAEENQWIALYRSWIHPSGKYKAMHEVVVGRAVKADFLLFGPFTKNNSKFFVKANKYPNYLSGVLIFQNRLTDGAGTFLNLDVTNSGPTQAAYGKWLENSKWEVGFNVNELNGQLDEYEGWKRGWQANIYGSYARRLTGILYANFSGGFKILQRSFNNTADDKELEFTQLGTPFFAMAIETWLE